MSKATHIVAIIQARLGSSRLPLKSLLCLRGYPLIDWVVNRVRQSSLVNKVVVAIPDTALDAILQDHLSRTKTACYQGSENDVLARFKQVADLTKATHIVRICADNPLVSGEAIDQLIKTYFAEPCDYAYNHIPRNNLWPDGLGAEIISSTVLTKLYETADLPSQREHCLNYIWDHAEDFAIKTFNPSEPYLCRPDVKLDIDRVEDYQRLANLPLWPEMPLDVLMQLFPQKSTKS